MKIGLGLIVRNEEIDLPACLRSFLPDVDMACIIDTGSTDNTLAEAQKILMEWGKPWTISSYLDANEDVEVTHADGTKTTENLLCDFSRARNEYVKELEKMGADYIWSVDADDTKGDWSIASNLEAQGWPDVCSIRYRLTPSFWFLSYKVWRAGLGIRWHGRVHEVIGFDWNKHKVAELPIEVQHTYSSCPGQETGTKRNMRILKKEIYPPLRSIFYWANENVDAGNHAEALKWYKEYIRRVSDDGDSCWPVELAHCYWRAARWANHLGKREEAIALSLELLNKDPSWAESWCELAYTAQCLGDYKSMRDYVARALALQYTPRLFSEVDKYTTTPAAMLKWLNDNGK